jgi:hypothetical protein
MEQVIEDKLASILQRRDFLFVDYNELPFATSLKNMNMMRVRGSVRLANLRIVLPVDVYRARQKVLNYSYM